MEHLADEEDADPVVQSLFKAWNGLSKDNKGKLKSILRERTFTLRLRDWSELKDQRLEQYEKEEALARPDSELAKSFKPGDKMYGIHEMKERPNVGRKPQMNMIENLLSQYPGKAHILVDTINNTLGISSKTAVESSNITDQEALSYLKFIESHPRYGPKFQDEKTDIKKSCKAALEYNTTVTGNTVHFELSGIDMAQVVSKTDKSVTGSELRSLFRQAMRKAPKNGSPGVSLQNVKFYMFGKEVKPPWVTEPELWAQYGEQVLKKMAESQNSNSSMVTNSNSSSSANKTIDNGLK